MLHLLVPLTGDRGPALALAELVWTHGVHGFLWAAAVALLARSRTPASARSWMWRAALFGPLITTALSAILWPVLNVEFASVVLSPRAGGAYRLGASSAISTWHGAAYRLDEGLWRGFALAWSAALLLGLARFARAAWLVSRSVRGSQPSADARARLLLDGLVRHTRLKRVRLMESCAATSPFSIGLRQICLPKRLIDGMADSEVEAVLAHELAHLERRDGLWFPALAFVEAVLWAYPLTRWVSSRARSCAELACDDRAVALTKKPRALAQALVHVAESAVQRQRCALLPSIAGSSGGLLTRVERLVGADAGATSQLATGLTRWAVACLVVTGCGLSAISLDLPRGEPPLPEVSAIERELAALDAREPQLEAELAAMLSEPELSSSDAPSRRDELEQELRHSHQMRAFLEAELRATTASSEPVAR